MPVLIGCVGSSCMMIRWVQKRMRSESITSRNGHVTKIETRPLQSRDLSDTITFISLWWHSTLWAEKMHVLPETLAFQRHWHMVTASISMRCSRSCIRGTILWMRYQTSTKAKYWHCRTSKVKEKVLQIFSRLGSVCGERNRVCRFSLMINDKNLASVKL